MGNSGFRAAIAAVVLGMAASSTGPARASLVSQWSGNGNALDSTGNNPGTLVNGVTFAAGQVGQAFSFHGQDYIQAGTVGMPTNNQDRTMFLWFNSPSQSEDLRFLAGYGAFGSDATTYELGLRGNQVWFSQWGQAVFAGSWDPSVWHSLAVTNVGNSETVYLDGDQIATGSLPMNTLGGTRFFIGGIGGLGYYFNGLIDDVRVYDTALSAEEIRTLSTVPSVPEPSTIVSGGIAVFLGLAFARCGRKAKEVA